jgi:formamidopyrimidine-DNA glycosylase
MPEGPEVKIASDYFNEVFSLSKQIEFEIISEYYHQKYFDVFNTINYHLRDFKPTFTVGKNTFLELANNQIFNFHFGMTGGWSSKLIKHCHFRVSNSNNEIFFKDVRKFGNMKIITQSQFNEKYNPAYDLLNESYSLKRHLSYLGRIINTKKSICSVIMDQKYFPGVGNYIKSESLYSSKIHPEEKWGNLHEDMIINLIKNIQRVMNNSYKSGGAELKDFKNPFESSKFKLKIYGKQYTEQNNLVTSIKTSDSRKTWFCSKQQKLI